MKTRNRRLTFELLCTGESKPPDERVEAITAEAKDLSFEVCALPALQQVGELGRSLACGTLWKQAAGCPGYAQRGRRKRQGAGVGSGREAALCTIGCRRPALVLRTLTTGVCSVLVCVDKRDMRELQLHAVPLQCLLEVQSLHALLSTAAMNENRCCAPRVVHMCT